MNLQQIRKQQRLSQEQLAELSGLNVRTIQRLEKGSAPSLETLNRLAAALDIEASDITPTTEEDSQISSSRDLSTVAMWLAIASILILLAAKSETLSPQVGAFFYISAAVCFIVVAIKMRKKRLGALFG